MIKQWLDAFFAMLNGFGQVCAPCDILLGIAGAILYALFGKPYGTKGK